MTHLMLAEVTASLSEFRKRPIATVAAGEGAAVAIIHRNAPAFYCIPASAYEVLLEQLDDLQLAVIVADRTGQSEIPVLLTDL